MSTKLSLFEQCSTYCTGVNSKIKNECKLIIPQMLATIKSLKKDLDLKADKLKQASAKIKSFEEKAVEFPNLRENSQKMHIYASYSNCLINKKEENIVIFKSTATDLDLRKEAFVKLKKIQDKVDVKKIKVNKKDTMIIEVKDKHQQDLIMKELKDEPSFKVSTPKSQIPSILIKDIERDPDIDNYEEYIKDQLADNNEIDKKNIVIKKIKNNSKFRSMRCIVNLDKQSTINILKSGNVKIGFKICSLERVINLRQCYNSFRFGHFAKDLQGNITCKNQKACSYCASPDHQQDKCLVKNDTDNHKCVNCKESHNSFHRSCESRKEKERFLLSKCLC